MRSGLRNSIIQFAKNQRRLLRRARQQWRYQSLSLQNAPILFANSFPKSGTHLLTQIMEGFPFIGPAVNSGMPAVVMYDGETGRERTRQEILSGLNHLSHGDTAYGHLHALPWIQDVLTSDVFATIFILRDPRDVVVSHVHYVTDIEPNHVHHAYYTQVLQSFDERLKTSILGRPDAANPFLDIAGRFAPFVGWLDNNRVLTLKYEDLMADPLTLSGQILDYAIQRGFPISLDKNKAVEALVSRINPQKSPTFRKGKSGGWKSAFTQEHKDIFKDLAGQLLIDLGYEKDTNW